MSPEYTETKGADKIEPLDLDLKDSFIKRPEGFQDFDAEYAAAVKLYDSGELKQAYSKFEDLLRRTISVSPHHWYNCCKFLGHEDHVNNGFCSFTTAVEYADSAYKNTSKLATESIDPLLYLISKQYADLLASKDPKTASGIYKVAIDQANVTYDTHKTPEVLTSLYLMHDMKAWVETCYGDYPAAISDHHKALALAKKIGRNDDINAHLERLSNVYIMNSNWELAKANINQQIEILENAEVTETNQKNLADSYYRLACIEEICGSPAERDAAITKFLCCAEDFELQREIISNNTKRFPLPVSEKIIECILDTSDLDTEEVYDLVFIREERRYALNGSDQEVIAQIESCLNSYPTYGAPEIEKIELLILQALAYYREQNKDAAIEAQTIVCEFFASHLTDPDDYYCSEHVRSLLNLAQYLETESGNNQEEIITNYTKAKELLINADFSSAACVQIDYCLELAEKHPDFAEELFEKARSAVPLLTSEKLEFESKIDLNAAKYYLATDRKDQAIIAARASVKNAQDCYLKHDPKLNDALLFLANLYYQTGEHEKAGLLFAEVGRNLSPSN